MWYEAARKEQHHVDLLKYIHIEFIQLYLKVGIPFAVSKCETGIEIMVEVNTMYELS